MAVKAQLFITCLGEQFASGTLRNMVAVLERLGVRCDLPAGQVCCGQPFSSSGFQSKARDFAHAWINVFERTDGYIVAPSGSCVDMVRHHYPELFADGSAEQARAKAVGERTFEFSQFLVHVLNVTDTGAAYPHKVTYHAACHLLRNLDAHSEAKQLLRAVRGLELVSLPGEETCCGFGGVFSVIYPEVSRAMMEAKVRNIRASGADTVVACDTGCLMNIAGGLQKTGAPVRTMHLIDVLAQQG